METTEGKQGMNGSESNGALMQGVHERARYPVTVFGIATPVTGCLFVAIFLFLLVEGGLSLRLSGGQ